MASFSVRSLRDVAAGAKGGPLTIDKRVSEAVVIGFAWTVGLAGLIWGTIYLALGQGGAALYPYGFSVISVVNVLAYRRHHRFRLFAGIEMCAILLVPWALSLHLGGMAASGGVGLWSFLAPIAGLLVIGPGVAALTFTAFGALTAVSVWVDAAFGPASLSQAATDAFLFLNVTGVSLVAFWAMRTFLTANERLSREQGRLREVEKAYLAQEVMMRQQDRLATLGRLSAGVAHELNNPASAAGRATAHLEDIVGRLIDDAVGLLSFGIGPEGLGWVAAMAHGDGASDPLDVSDREDRIARWLQLRAVDDPWEMASALAELGFDSDSLDVAAERYRQRQVIAAVQWISDVARARRLLGEVRTSTGRISQIVGALKGYSHMDGAQAVGVDLESGIDDTLVILRSQLTGIDVRRERHPQLPTVAGNPGELNQAWTNILANAAEALGGSGAVTIRTRSDAGHVVVEFEDDGPGIPEDLLESIFDPFVTTKPPGEGTGLGLNVTHQIVVDRHHGSIAVESRPGRTRFVVRLPAEQERAHE